MDAISLTVPWFDQLALVATGYVIKPLYMIITGYLVAYLRPFTSKDTKYLAIGLAGFLTGELVCAINYALTQSTSDTLEIIHGLGMVWAGMFIPWSFFIFLDERILHISSPDKRCTWLPLCGHCAKTKPSGCGLKSVTLYAMPAFFLIALLPLSRAIDPFAYTIKISNSDILFFSTSTVQHAEFFAYPLIASALFLFAGLTLKIKNDINPWALFFFPGLGFMLFSLFRFFLSFTFHNTPIWSNVWEELTEFLAICFIMTSLWVFKKDRKNS